MGRRFALGTGGSRDVTSAAASVDRWIARPVPRATPRYPLPRGDARACG